MAILFNMGRVIPPVKSVRGGPPSPGAHLRAHSTADAEVVLGLGIVLGRHFCQHRPLAPLIRADGAGQLT